ncbi:glucosaminidase domain-containing protein [Bacillus rubiinfantis]|uniref:glucosaminidase domain-containing protein n=1 Tax=Bacillus rubiinfantis TaxID=1499680 RepID=UPI0005A99761|nr:glucosaminidase domain-containing protein [Bacillus rubiinfantis]
MKISDNWFLTSMLINSLNRNENTSMTTSNTSSDFTNLLLSVLNNMMTNSNTQSDSTLTTMSLIPSAFTNTAVPTIDYVMANSSSAQTLKTDGSLQFTNVSADQLNEQLGGKLAGNGEIFIQAGKLYNVNPALLAAIAQHETGNGTSRAAMEKNNIAGMMGINGLKSYSSIEESIMDMARNISKNYLGQGLASIAEIGAKYAPVGASNDPTGLNNHWVNGVSKFFNQLTV